MAQLFADRNQHRKDLQYIRFNGSLIGGLRDSRSTRWTLLRLV